MINHSTEREFHTLPYCRDIGFEKRFEKLLIANSIISSTCIAHSL